MERVVFNQTSLLPEDGVGNEFNDLLLVGVVFGKLGCRHEKGLDLLQLACQSFRHKGIESFFRDGSKAGIQSKHAEKLRNQLFALDTYFTGAIKC